MSINKEQVLKLIDRLPFIMCIEDAKFDNGVNKEWMEQFVIRREELKQKIKELI